MNNPDEREDAAYGAVREYFTRERAKADHRQSQINVEKLLKRSQEQRRHLKRFNAMVWGEAKLEKARYLAASWRARAHSLEVRLHKVEVSVGKAFLLGFALGAAFTCGVFGWVL